MQVLSGLLPNTGYGNGNAIAADGVTVVGHVFTDATPVTQQAFRWTSAGGMVGLGELPGGNSASSATAVSVDGAVIVGGGHSATGNEAFRWTNAGGMVGLGDLPGGSYFSAAYGVSGDGAVVVGRSSSGSYYEAFRWTEAGGMVGLGDFPGGILYSSAEAISADGSVIVGYANAASGPEAFRWTAGSGMVGLGQLAGGTWSSAKAVSDDGSIIAGESLYHAAFIWNESHGMRNLEDLLTIDLGLDLTGWHLGTVTGISTTIDTVYLVGNGTNPQGQFDGFLATLPKSALMPEPGSLVLIALARLLMGRRRKDVTG